MNPEWTRRRYIAASTASLVAIAGCTTSDDGDNGNAPPANKNENDNGEETNSNVIFEPGQSHTLEGEGPTDTDRFELDEGLMRYRYESSASDVIFTSSLVDMDRDGRGWALDERSLTNYISPIEGELMSIVSGGEYLVSIDVSGPWSIEIDQPGATNGDREELPLEASGSGPGYIGPVDLYADAEVHATHDGNSSFSVHSVTVDGHWNVPVNDSGTVDSTRVFRDEGTAWISVAGDGDWMISLD